MSNRVPVVFCVDVEPDGLGHLDPNDRHPWRGFELMCELIGRIRPALEDATSHPVHWNWFLRMDPQIERIYGTSEWVASTYWKQLELLSSHGDTVGLHTHATRWREDQGFWEIDYENQDWINQCVEMSFETFEACFGEPCRHHRFGDRFLNNDILALAEQLGARVDLTTEPGEPSTALFQAGIRISGFLPDYTMVPRVPFRPSIEDFRYPGKSATRSIWMLPLSATDDDPGGPPPRRRRWLPAASSRSLPRPTRRNLAMWKEWPTAASFWEAAVSSWRDLPRPYLALAMRADETIRPMYSTRFNEMLQYVVETQSLADQLVFTTVDEALSQLGAPRTIG